LTLIASVLGLHTVSLAQQTTPDFTLGEVKKIDLNTAKITLKHEAIQALDMPAMTMVFAAQDPNDLKSLKEGDAVKFKVGKSGTQYTAHGIEKVQP
jgi:Cu/Ag efflux protein CusF